MADNNNNETTEAEAEVVEVNVADLAVTYAQELSYNETTDEIDRSDAADEAEVALMRRYLDIHVTQRGPVVTDVTMALIGAAVVPQVLASVMETLNKRFTSARVVEVVDQERADAILGAFQAFVDSFDASDLNAANGTDDDELTELDLAYLARISSAATTAAGKVNVGSGEVQRFTDTLLAMVTDDVVPSGSTIVSTYNGTTVEAVVETTVVDGETVVQVVIGSDRYGSLSAAYEASFPVKSGNGWVQWAYNGTKLAKLRRG